eukprot:CAMPEP_0177634198 /NCGR_PEP_ID=MMETSP0447-20121125/3241_1 /TAXON_ID=0 /ORGANISM="Stygamoeba regulata, Strain BSH-02190019" /LENGTH=315 /DNA_ID=CAMNT_0019135905 /DNA_START=151 /DNA_END=1098 /DNA_ORIENTATION=-
MEGDGVTIRVASTDEELRFYFESAEREGWMPGPHDVAAFRLIDPDGMLVAVDASGTVVGGIVAAAYDSSYGFIGLYIVRPDWRGRGVGLQLWRRALDHLGARTIGLDGVPAQQSNYAKWGFVKAYDNVRYVVHGPACACGGTASTAAATAAAAEPAPALPGTADAAACRLVCPAADVPRAALEQYDRALHPAPRPTLLHAWLRLPGTASAALCTSDGTVVGFGAVRQAAGGGWRVGPLAADTPAHAARLLEHLRTAVPQHACMSLDVPAANVCALHLMAHVRADRTPHACGRMYTRAPPALALHRVFAVLSLELG